MGDLYLLPQKGNVAFGTGKDQWGFSLTRFAQIFADKFKIERSKMMQKLWGDNFFDKEKKCWTTNEISASGKQLKRTFVEFIMDPIIKMCRAVIEGDKPQVEKMLKAVDVQIKKEEQELVGKQLLKVIMSRWLNAADIILEMMVLHLPSPKVA